MKIITGVLFFAAALRCGPAAAMPPEAEAVFEKAGVKLTDADLYRVAEIYNFWDQKGESVWPGVDMTTTPVQLVFPAKLGVLIGHPNPPEGCIKEDIKLPGFNKTFCHRPDRSFLYGAATGREGRSMVVSLNPMDLYEEYIKDYYARNNIKAEKYTKPYLQYLGEAAHELLHAHQARESRYLPEKEKEVNPPKLNKADYPYQDEENCLLLGLEGRVLADLLDATDPAGVRELWRDFTLLRSARHRRLPGDIVRLEQYMELSEGTAQYVGWTVQYGANGDVKPLPETSADPRFTGYASSDTLSGMIKQNLLALENPRQGRMMPYVYFTGVALVSSMEKAVPGWKKDIFRKIFGFRSGLDGLITAKIKPEGSDKERLKAVFARYKADEIRARVKESLDKDLADNKAKLDKFYAAPGRRYAFSFRGVKPVDAMVFAPGLLTEYKALRVYEAGITKIICNYGKKNEKKVEFSKNLPVLHDRAGGGFELAAAGGEVPVIKADKTDVKKDRTVYRGGVEFSNGIFSWKGDKLEVAEKDGVTRLIF
ncbi:MAG TPA: hypothetical protein PKI19_11560 [Elusimicrobiales bacterium]|nr:hypothetical protein [Elusimicrobiales bacterium]